MFGAFKWTNGVECTASKGRAACVSDDGNDQVMRLLEGHNGLIQSPRLFTDALWTHMESGGLKGCVFDPCLFRVQYAR